ncbi:MAG: rhomboid family intramembrane serine protease [Candidatus Nanopelagicales bacterium]
MVRFVKRRPQSAAIVQLIVLLNTSIFLYAWLTGSVNEFAFDFGLHPPAVALNGETWRLLTAGFLHASFLHLLFNMYVLWLLGSELEEILGHLKFISLYLIALIGGSTASYWFSDPASFSVGASGAVFGLMGAFLVVGSRLRQDVSQIMVLIAINVGIGFVVPGIDWRAHLGGLLSGAAIAWFLARKPDLVGRLLALTGVLGMFTLLQQAIAARTNELLFLFGF